MTETTPVESRSDKKERTRRAILDAALRLTEDTGLAGLSLRQVAKEVGIVPTAFYRHFDSIDQLGLALVEESFGALRAMIRDVRQQRSHFLFIARERAAGPLSVREAIRHEIELCERELATDLARLPGPDRWTAEDLRVLSNLIVTAMVSTAEQLLSTGARPDAEKEVTETARTQLRMVLIGALNWESRP